MGFGHASLTRKRRKTLKSPVPMTRRLLVTVEASGLSSVVQLELNLDKLKHPDVVALASMAPSAWWTVSQESDPPQQTKLTQASRRTCLLRDGHRRRHKHAAIHPLTYNPQTLTCNHTQHPIAGHTSIQTPKQTDRRKMMYAILITS